MKHPIDLRPDHAKIVHEIIARHLPAGVYVRVFGSRAKWTAKPHSDLDLVLKGKEPLPRSVLGDLAEAFSESDLPFRVDVVDWHGVAPSFQAVMDRDGVLLTVPLGQVATLLSGGTPSKSNSAFWNGDVPWLTPKDMGQWNGTTDSHVTAAAIGKGTRLAPENTSFVAVRGMSLHNEIRVVRSERPLTFNQDIKAVVAGPSIDPSFLYYALAASKPVLLGLVSAAGHGTGVLDTDRLRSLDIPVLPMNEQRSIAHTISALDDKIELNRRMNETLEAMAQAIFRDWFVDFGPTRRKIAGGTDPIAIMGGLMQDPARAAEFAALFPNAFGDVDLPFGWRKRPLDSIADFLNGLALQKFPAKAGEPDLPVIKIAELRNGLSDRTHRATRSLPPKFIIKDGDFIFSWSGSLMAKVWTEGEGALNQHLFKVSSDAYPQWFYALWVHHHMPEFQLIAASKATTMGHIQRMHLTDAITVCPPCTTIAELSAVMQPIWDRMIHNELENRTLAETRDYLLPRLMKGEAYLSAAENFAKEVLK